MFHVAPIAHHAFRFHPWAARHFQIVGEDPSYQSCTGILMGCRIIEISGAPFRNMLLSGTCPFRDPIQKNARTSWDMFSCLGLIAVIMGQHRLFEPVSRDGSCHKAALW